MNTAVKQDDFKRRDDICAYLRELLNTPDSGGFESVVHVLQEGIEKLFSDEKFMLNKEIAYLKENPKQDGHTPIIGMLYEIPTTVGKALFVSEKKYNPSAERMCHALFSFLKTCNDLTEKLGKGIWCTVPPDDRILWGFSQMGDGTNGYKVFESFANNLSYRKLSELSQQMPLTENEHVRKNIIGRLLEQKKTELLEKVSQSFYESPYPGIDINTIRYEDYYSYKDDFPVPLEKEVLYGFVTKGKNFDKLPTEKLQKLVDETRSVVLAKALLERPDYKSSFERFMFTVELLMNK